MRLEIGKIINTHGLKGEVKVAPWCDDNDVFLTLKTIATAEKTYNIENVKFHKNSVIIKLSEVDSIEKAQKLQNKIIYVERKQLAEPDDGTYYIAELIGIEVFEEGRHIGVLKECLAPGSNDVYVVKREDGTEVLIPALAEVIKKIDIVGRRMDVLPFEVE